MLVHAPSHGRSLLHSSTSMQRSSIFSKPGGQRQRYEPIVLLQMASSHGSPAHSSTSIFGQKHKQEKLTRIASAVRVDHRPADISP